MNKDTYSIRISLQVYNALDAHMEFLSRVNPDAADKQRKEILHRISSLRCNPYLYPVFDSDVDMPEYRKMIIGRYIILYVIEEEPAAISIDLIWDTRMDNVL